MEGSSEGEELRMKKYSEGESEGGEMQWNEDGQIEGWKEVKKESGV